MILSPYRYVVARFLHNCKYNLWQQNSTVLVSNAAKTNYIKRKEAGSEFNIRNKKESENEKKIFQLNKLNLLLTELVFCQ